jgi:hypothetical protein
MTIKTSGIVRYDIDGNEEGFGHNAQLESDPTHVSDGLCHALKQLKRPLTADGG